MTRLISFFRSILVRDRDESLTRITKKDREIMQTFYHDPRVKWWIMKPDNRIMYVWSLIMLVLVIWITIAQSSIMIERIFFAMVAVVVVSWIETWLVYRG